MFGSRYDPTKLKLNLKLAVTRLQMLQKKNENQGILARKEIAKLLEKGKDELARIKVEQVIRDDYQIEVMELMEMYCNLLSTRFGLIDSVKYCDEGIREAVCSIIWATPRLAGEIGEFKEIQRYLIARYGKDFGEQALENRNQTVNDRVINKLNIHQPAATIVDGYLQGIAQTYKVNWNPPDRALDLELTGMQAGIPSVPTDMFPVPPGKEAASRPPLNLPNPPAQNPAFAPPSMSYPAPPTMSYPAPMTQPFAPSYPGPQGASGYSVPQGASGYPGPQAASGYPAMSSNAFPHTMGNPDPFPAHPGYASLPILPSPPVSPQQFPSASAGMGSTASDVPDFDELTRRFQNLKSGK